MSLNVLINGKVIKLATNCSNLIEDSTAQRLWPASVLLALLLKRIPLQEKIVLELGAGMGFTAAVIGPLCKAYICQDLPGVSISSASTPATASVSSKTIHGKWGSRQLSAAMRELQFNYLVMADCFYRKADFPYLLATIADALTANVHLEEVICIHHHRNVNDSIAHFLPAFGLDAMLLPWPEGISEEIDEFLEENPLLAESFQFASLKIIRFTIKK